MKKKGLNSVAPLTVKWENNGGTVSFKGKLFSKDL